MYFKPKLQAMMKQRSADIYCTLVRGMNNPRRQPGRPGMRACVPHQGLAGARESDELPRVRQRPFKCRSRRGNSELDFDAELQRVVGRIPVEALQKPHADAQARAFIFLVGVG
jgi:hypothetical protein